MTQASTLAFPEENLVGSERTLYALLVETQRRPSFIDALRKSSAPHGMGSHPRN
jgi:hypothetical protein